MEKKDKTFIQDILEAIWVVGFDKEKLVTTNLEEIPRNIAKCRIQGNRLSSTRTRHGF